MNRIGAFHTGIHSKEKESKKYLWAFFFHLDKGEELLSQDMHI